MRFRRRTHASHYYVTPVGGENQSSEPWIQAGPGHNTPRTSNCPFPCLTCGWRLHKPTTRRRRFWSRTRTLAPACRLADTEPGTCPRPGRRRGSHSPPAAALISNQYQDQQLMITTLSGSCKYGSETRKNSLKRMKVSLKCQRNIG